MGSLEGLRRNAVFWAVLGFFGAIFVGLTAASLTGTCLEQYSVQFRLAGLAGMLTCFVVGLVALAFEPLRRLSASLGRGIGALVAFAAENADWLSTLPGRKITSRAERVPSEDAELEAFFTDVEYLQQVFRDLATAPRLSKRILVIHGVGGVGKSSLLRIGRLFCKREGIPVALVLGDEVKSPLEILRSLTSDLTQAGVTLSTFAGTLQRYRAIQAKVEQKAKQADRATPLVGPLVGVPGRAGAQALVNWLHGFLSRPEIDLYLDPAKKLTEGFLHDVAQVAQEHRLVLILDHYEQMSSLDDWIRDLLRVLHRNILVVIAGQTIAGTGWGLKWAGWMRHAQVEELKAMNEDDARTLACRYYAMCREDEPDPVQVEAIVQFARGLPLAVTTAVRLWVVYGAQEFQAVKPQVVADLLDQLMRKVPETIRPALQAAAVFNWFNEDVLRMVLGQEEVRAIYEELRQFPFVRSRVEGLTLHPTLREVINAYLATHAPERYETVHGQAAEFYEARLTKIEATGEKWGEKYKTLVLERLYHLLKVCEREGVELFAALYDGEAYYQVDFLQRVFATVGHWDLQDWGSRRMRYYEGRFELWHKGNLARAKEIFKSLHQELDFEDIELLAKVSLELASSCRESGEFDDAIEYCTQSKSLFERVGDKGGANWALQIMGSAYNRKGEYVQAIQSLEEAIEHAGADEYLLGQCLYRAGDPYRRKGECDKALEYFSESLAIWQRLDDKFMIGLLQGWMGDALRSQYRLDEAFAWFSRSLQTFQELDRLFPGSWIVKVNIGNPKYNLARICLLKGDLDSALRYAEETREVWETASADPTRREMLARLFGRIFYANGELSRAKEYYLVSLDLAEWMDHSIDTLLYLTTLEYDEGAVAPHLGDLETAALEHCCWEHLARLKLVQGNLSIDESKSLASVEKRRGELLDDAFHRYSEAMTYALRFNRYLLDHVLEQVISKCKERGAEGRTVLARLAAFWRTGKTDEGMPFAKAERVGREREKGDGRPQVMVVDQIEAALS